MNLGPSAPGANDAITDASTLPRPVGPDAATALEPSTPPMTMCCNSAFICPTVSRFPHTATMRTRFALPLAAVITPLAEGEGVPEVKLISSEHQGTAGIVRCRRCRTYINPFVKWVDGGRRWTCNICLAMNDVPADYFCTLDAATGLRRDVDQRLELSLGSVEYVAPKEYMVRGPMPAVYFFLIDVSTPAVHSGLLETLASTLDSVLDSLPGDSRTRIGFMTFDRTLHFYNLKSSLSQPQMMVVPDVDEPFVPMPDDLLVNLKDSKTVVRALLESLKTQFTERSCAECAMGPALQAAFMVMSHIGGKLLLFLSSPPTLGIGRLRAQRDNAALYGSDREHLLRTPEDKFFKDFAAEASRVQITIDLFVFHPTFIDLASLSALPRYTGGQVYYYPGFHCQRDATKLQAELSWNLKRTTAWEAVMRIRCSKGLRIIGFTGHFFIRSSDLLALPTVDPDKSFAIHLTHEDSVLESQTVYLQCALLYTSSCGQRRIRVHTLAAPATSDLGEVYKSVDAAQVATLLAKLAVEKSYHTRLHEVRTLVQGKLISSLKEYRALHSGHFRGVNKLIYPESFKHIHVWVLGLLKTAAIRGGADDVNADERVAVGLEIVSCTFKQVLRLLYPSLFQLHDLRLDWGQKDADGKVKLPPTVALSKEHLRPDGAYLLDNGRVFVLWLGQALPREYVSSLFGMDPSTSPGDYSSMAVEPPKDNPVSQRVNAVLRRLREGRGVHAHCYVARQGSQTEAHIAPLFVEDRTHNTHGYLDFVHHLHRQIGAKQ
ncbi:unnamed protein product [Ostreobium quekettii]|uniref:Uncharacterized protein n=1 Tax=Ostreobium quekettii TaxID=121088 RepID=A0A8S1IR04_9CHLO|nr:unnamed protein product [Ostreobium quekettii]|eukprot:evm.model.scf_264.8 EVM.evm.TU.scf_264.8   scf_264:95492-104451(+)